MSGMINTRDITSRDAFSYEPVPCPTQPLEMSIVFNGAKKVIAYNEGEKGETLGTWILNGS